jgi:hypothetical protein
LERCLPAGEAGKDGKMEENPVRSANFPLFQYSILKSLLKFLGTIHLTPPKLDEPEPNRLFFHPEHKIQSTKFK